MVERLINIEPDVTNDDRNHIKIYDININSLSQGIKVTKTATC